MTYWRVKFFPPSGERNSPHDYVVNLADENDRAMILLRLERMQQHRKVDWPPAWINHMGGKIWELYARGHRLMYCLDSGTIVILHACKKVSNKTRERDLNIAKNHLARYLDSIDEA